MIQNTMKTFMETSFFAQINLEIYRNPVRPTMSDAAAGPEINPTYIQHRPFNFLATMVFKKHLFWKFKMHKEIVLRWFSSLSSLAYLEPELELFEVLEIMVRQIIITIIANVINLKQL